MNQFRDIGVFKADNETGTKSKVDIAKKHGISAMTLCGYTSNKKWNYEKMIDEVLVSPFTV